MKREVTYTCSSCGNKFEDMEEAIMCEISHPNGFAKVIEDHGTEYPKGPVFIYLKTGPSRYIHYMRMSEKEVSQ